MERFLEGFQERMRIVGIVESIVNRRGRNTSIEEWFAPHMLTNLVFSLLLFIMEKTLAEDTECDKGMISRFVDQTCLTYFDLDLGEDKAGEVTEYILKSVLQNNGDTYYFSAMDYGQRAPVNLPIRLIEDHLRSTVDGHQLTYTLSDQGYDFLFRTKEVDQELQFSMEELRLRELLKRKNFSRASEQSDSLIQMIRQKKRELSGLMQRIKEDIDTIDADDQEALIKSIYDMLEDEYEIMGELETQVERADKQIYQDYRAQAGMDENLRKAQDDLGHIKENLRTIISEQRDLLVGRRSLMQLYEQTLDESLAYQNENRYDFEEVILRRMEDHPQAVMEFWRLANPLFLPDVNHHLNIQRIFEWQGMMKVSGEEEAKNLVTEELAEDLEAKKAVRYQGLYMEIVGGLVDFVRDRGGRVRFSAWLDHLKSDPSVLEAFMEDRLLFTVLLRLYDLGEMNLQALWQEESQMFDVTTDEFDPGYCFIKLKNADDSFFRLKIMQVEKVDDEVVEMESRVVQGEMTTIERSVLTDFEIRVEWDDE